MTAQADPSTATDDATRRPRGRARARRARRGRRRPRPRGGSAGAAGPLGRGSRSPASGRHRRPRRHRRPPPPSRRQPPPRPRVRHVRRVAGHRRRRSSAAPRPPPRPPPPPPSRRRRPRRLGGSRQRPRPRPPPRTTDGRGPGRGTAPPPPRPRPPPPTAPPAPAPGEPVLAPGPVPGGDVHHLLRRATYGPTPASLAAAPAPGLRRLARPPSSTPASVPDPVGDAVDAAHPGIFLSTAAARVHYADEFWRMTHEVVRWRVARSVWSTRQLHEVMTDLMHNHLNVPIGAEGPSGHAFHRYHHDVVRAHALGSFADMLVASAEHPAMLHYLNADTSTRTSPNENYARELLELHTVGVGSHTEADVKAAALLLTGWRTRWPWETGGEPYTAWFDSRRHHVGPLTVLGRTYPNAVARRPRRDPRVPRRPRPPPRDRRAPGPPAGPSLRRRRAARRPRRRARPGLPRQRHPARARCCGRCSPRGRSTRPAAPRCAGRSSATSPRSGSSPRPRPRPPRCRTTGWSGCCRRTGRCRGPRPTATPTSPSGGSPPGSRWPA